MYPMAHQLSACIARLRLSEGVLAIRRTNPPSGVAWETNLSHLEVRPRSQSSSWLVWLRPPACRSTPAGCG